jgi:hypothetical protein
MGRILSLTASGLARMQGVETQMSRQGSLRNP